MNRLRALWQNLNASLWFVPTLMVAGGPAFALLAAVAVGGFGLVVKQNLLGRKRQVDAVFGELVFDGFQHPVLGVEHVGLPRRVYPPAGPDIDRAAGQVHHQRLGRGVL
ncbi:hypothetical protein MTP16_02610 [Hymenobacter monticola]|uniref:Uncharacterized protein n=1 Tax=Hymenobacter monticola TaxID=1705399 RepID=A0ABY4B6Q0_9BACT|nr:hypothetical protein [Hymenobacter monticola]UOE34554.1 hypothetical protein MTP16_02610 [Hymenobacter monticola]